MPKMTERVLEHLRETRESWTLCPGGEIRRITLVKWGYGDTPARLCPLESLRGLAEAPAEPHPERVGAGRRWTEQRAITAAADAFGSCDPVLRARMLAAAGLTEEQGVE